MHKVFPASSSSWPPLIMIISTIMIFIRIRRKSLTAIGSSQIRRIWDMEMISCANCFVCQNFIFSFSWFSEYLAVVILRREWRILLKYHYYYGLNYWNTIGVELDKRENKRGVRVLRCAAILKECYYDSLTD